MTPSPRLARPLFATAIALVLGASTAPPTLAATRPWQAIKRPSFQKVGHPAPAGASANPLGGAKSGARASGAARPRGGSAFYVSRAGNDKDGTSWATAWNELNQIKWSSVPAGSTIYVDGGALPCVSPYDFTTTRPGVTCGMEYDTTLTVGASGSVGSPITLRLSDEVGRNGTAVFFGGRSIPLPYCHQTGYTGSAVRTYGVLIGGYHDVTIDGGHRGGIMVYGATYGVQISSTAANDITLARMEIFDNGTWGTSGGGGLYTDNPGIKLLGGTNTHIIGDLIHDNGQDEIQDGTRSPGSLNGLLIDTSWLYAKREHPSHPGEPFNDLQSVGDDSCTHADAIQLWSGGSGESGLTVSRSILGPLLNQGLYPGDGGTGATWTNVTVTDSLLLVIRHNLITDNAVHGWTLDDDTFFAEQGGFELPANGTNTMTNVVKQGGYVVDDNWSGTTSGNVWWSGDPLPGQSVNQNPNFVSAPTGTLNGYDAYAAANFTALNGLCQGATLHTFADILLRIDELP